MKEAEVALACYREAVRLAPSYEQALNNLGNLEKAQGRSELAIRLLRQATKVVPGLSFQGYIHHSRLIQSLLQPI